MIVRAVRATHKGVRRPCHQVSVQAVEGRIQAFVDTLAIHDSIWWCTQHRAILTYITKSRYYDQMHSVDILICICCSNNVCKGSLDFDILSCLKVTC